MCASVRRLTQTGFVLLAFAPACGSDAPATHPSATPDELMDPQTCAGCHPKHYEEWASSMHAYAAEDPLFLAMNRRGQREAGIGPFCVNCHAPMAVRTGATTDGLNLEALPASQKGVTCYFCHSVASVNGTHDNPLALAEDGAFRGELGDALPNGFHASQYSTLHDRDRLESSTLCGSCHDLVNAHGVHLERTFAEWQETVFAQPTIGTTCGQCHMDQSRDLEPAASLPSAPLRRLRSHRFPAVDLPLTARPSADTLAQAVQTFLDSSLQSALCVRGTATNAQIEVVLDNVAAGHRFPSGAAQDRRVWLEVVAYAGAEPIYTSGVVPADGSLGNADTGELAWLGDCLLGDRGGPVRMFWEAHDVESSLLPGQLTYDPADRRYYQSHVLFTYPRQTTSIPYPERVTLNLELAPFGLEVFDDLVASGDLSESDGDIAAMRVALAARAIGPELEWTPESATQHFDDRGVPTTCVSTSNLQANADKVAFVPHSRCAP